VEAFAAAAGFDVQDRTSSKGINNQETGIFIYYIIILSNYLHPVKYHPALICYILKETSVMIKKDSLGQPLGLDLRGIASYG
jgi:hypothetical protein